MIPPYRGADERRPAEISLAHNFQFNFFTLFIISKMEAAILASFLADAHALATHWCYQPEKIKELGSDTLMTTLLPPTLAGYHKTNNAGEFTPYGDQALILLQSLLKGKPFDVDTFLENWFVTMRSYTGYM